MATIDQRDYQVMQFVHTFKQLTAAQVRELVFSNTASLDPCYRSLDRLRRRKYLHRLEHRLVGGAKGGSGQYVWTLGLEGNRLMQGESRPPKRTINYHTLEIANTFVVLLRLERAGNLKIAGYLTEPDCHEAISGHKLEPDLFVELERPSGKLMLWLEVDMATSDRESEGAKQIKDKLRRYWAAYAGDDPHWPDYLVDRDNEGAIVYDRAEVDGHVVLDPRRMFPSVIWLAQDEWRLKHLQWLVAQEKPEAQQLFKVMTLDQLVQWLQ